MRDLTALRHLVGGEWRNDTATSALLNPSDLTDVVTERIEGVAGIVAINQTTSGADMHAPFEGTRLSGFGGAEQGTEAPRFFSRGKTTYLAD